MVKIKKVFTTGQVAKICMVAPRTVSKWFDAGRLRGYRIPGSQERRIPRDALIRFLKEYALPLGDLEEVSPKLLLVGVEETLLAQLKSLLSEDYQCERAASGFELGILVNSFKPDVVIIDLAIGRGEGVNIARQLHGWPECEGVAIFALASEDEVDPESLAEAGFSEVFKKPFDVALLVEKING